VWRGRRNGARLEERHRSIEASEAVTRPMSEERKLVVDELHEVELG